MYIEKTTVISYTICYSVFYRTINLFSIIHVTDAVICKHRIAFFIQRLKYLLIIPTNIFVQSMYQLEYIYSLLYNQDTRIPG